MNVPHKTTEDNTTAKNSAISFFKNIFKNTGTSAEQMVTTTTGNITCNEKALTENLVSCFTIKRRTINAKNVMQIAITITLTAGEPSFKAMYETGKFKRRIPPTTL